MLPGGDGRSGFHGVSLAERCAMPTHRTARFFGLLLGAIVVVASLSLWSLRRSETVRARTAHSLAVVSTFDAVGALVADARTSANHWLTTDEQAYKNQYDDARAELYPRIAELAELTLNDPLQHQRVLATEALLGLELSVLARSLSDRVVAEPSTAAEQLTAQLAAARLHEEQSLSELMRRDRATVAQAATALLISSALLFMLALAWSQRTRLQRVLHTVRHARA